MAELLQVESFDHWDENDPHTKWPVIFSSGMVISALYGRHNGGARIKTGGTAVSTVAGTDVGIQASACNMFERYFSVGSSQWNIGMAFRFEGIELQDHMPIISLISTGDVNSFLGTYYAPQVSLVFTPQQQLVFINGVYNESPFPVIGDYSPALKRGVWYYIEVAIGIGGAASFSLKIDGKTVINTTGNTDPLGTGSANGVRFFFHKSFRISGGNNERFYYVDDIYITNGGIAFTDVKVETDLPNNEGAVLQWTPSSGTLHFTQVDEASPDGDTTFNTATAAGNIDTYKFSTLETASGTVHGLTIDADMLNDAFDVTTAAAVIRESSVNYLATAQRIGTPLAAVPEYRGLIFGYLTNPATGNRFTISEINADEFGIDRVS